MARRLRPPRYQSKDTRHGACRHQGTSSRGSRPACGPSGCTTDWDSFGFDLQRTGYNPYESSVGVSNVGSLPEGLAIQRRLHDGSRAGLCLRRQGKRSSDEHLVRGLGTGDRSSTRSTRRPARSFGSVTVPHALYSCGGCTSQFSIGETPAIDRGKNLSIYAGRAQPSARRQPGDRKRSRGLAATIANYRHGDHNFMHGGLTYNLGQWFALCRHRLDLRHLAMARAHRRHRHDRTEHRGHLLSDERQVQRRGRAARGIWGPGGGVDRSVD